VAALLGIEIEALYEWYNQVKGVSLVSLETPGLRTKDGKTLNLLEMVSTDNAKSPAQLVQAHRLKALVAEAIDDLPYKEKVVISLYYSEELTMQEIGKVLDITESRVSQIHTKSILHLRNTLQRLLQEDLSV
jgi:RNA polymerase sigma factor for flagellar operon FliA